MRIVTFNANGIRAAARKGFFVWLGARDPDFVCIQETKAQKHQVPSEALLADRYVATFYDAEKKGYSGVAVYTRRTPDRIVRGTGIPDIGALSARRRRATELRFRRAPWAPRVKS